MYTVGLTGGIGSGKSLVAEIFTHLGIPVFNADYEAGRILEEDPSVKKSLAEWFGSDVYINDRPDRQKIAVIVFNDHEKLARMNGLIHPLVMQKFIRWCVEYQAKPYVIHEAAILMESGFYRHMDKTILVTAPEDIRIERVIQRDKTTALLVSQRMKNQWNEERKIPLADFIILNDGKSPLIPAILDIHNKLIL
jgi:dephospho-CoA kinase